MREPEDDDARAERADDEQERSTCVPLQRPLCDPDASGQRTHGRGTSQDAEPERPRVQDLAREDGQEGNSTAEKDGKQIEEDRAGKHWRVRG